MRFDIQRAQNSVTLAQVCLEERSRGEILDQADDQCFVAGLIPLSDVPTVTLSGSAPFVKVDGIRNAGDLVQAQGLFAIKCNPPA